MHITPFIGTARGVRELYEKAFNLADFHSLTPFFVTSRVHSVTPNGVGIKGKA